MLRDDYINEIKKIVSNNKKNFAQFLTAKKYNYSHLLKFIEEENKFRFKNNDKNSKK